MLACIYKGLFSTQLIVWKKSYLFACLGIKKIWMENKVGFIVQTKASINLWQAIFRISEYCNLEVRATAFFCSGNYTATRLWIIIVPEITSNVIEYICGSTIKVNKSPHVYIVYTFNSNSRVMDYALSLPALAILTRLEPFTFTNL